MPLDTSLVQFETRLVHSYVHFGAKPVLFNTILVHFDAMLVSSGIQVVHFDAKLLHFDASLVPYAVIKIAVKR